MTRRAALLAAAVAFASPAAALARTPAAPDARVAFANLHDGETVTNPVHVVFAVSGMTLANAGTNAPNTGHVHILIDTSLAPSQYEAPIPMDKQHLHYGKAQTEADITLPPGQHTLQLVMGDGAHRVHEPPVVSQVITVTVK